MDKTTSVTPQKTTDNKRRLSRLLTHPWVQFLLKPFYAFDRKMDGAVSFFVKHWGKSRFMISMSKRAQVLGIEKLWKKSPKAF